MFKVAVKVSLKKKVLDPQGKTVKAALESLGFASVSDVRMGKLIEITMRGSDQTKLKADIDEMCKKLLSNPIIEDYSYTIEEVAA
jgi:phosphoribosylformylglycinamidine synthase